MRIPLYLCFALVVSTLRAQDLPNTLLWRITPAAGGKASYLYGTFHTKNDLAFQFTDSVLPAMARCNSVIGELDFKVEQANALGLMAAMRLPDDERLEELFRKKDWKLVKTEMDEQLGTLSVLSQNMKPIFVLMLLSEGAMEGEQPELLDQYLLTTASANGQRTGGLETMAEQIAALDAIPLKDQATMLVEHCKEKDPGAEQVRMLEAYAAQDLATLMELAEGSSGFSGTMEKELITDRNIRMAHRMDSLIRIDTSCFFLVGAAHLPGETGLIKGMAARGYVVEPVLSAVSKNEPVVVPKN